MKASINTNVRQYIWNTVKRTTNSFSSLSVKHIGNGCIKCLWEISPLDNLKIKLSKSCFYAIRLFDISNNRHKNNATCIMKEIQVSKFQSSISFPIPINKGVYYFELGYRKRNGEWRLLASQDLNLGYRIKKVIKELAGDSWFNPKKNSLNSVFGTHEDAYQLSLNSKLGGSENIFSR